MNTIPLNQPHTLLILTEHQPVEFTYPAEPGSALELAIDGQVLEPFLRPGEAAWRWRWNPGAAVGLRQVVLLINGADGETERRERTVRVAPRKIDQERYEALMTDIQRLAYSIAYSLAGTSAEGAALQRHPPWERNRVEEYYTLFEGRFERFVRAVRRIAERPREHLRRVGAETTLGQAESVGADTLAQIVRGEFDPAPESAAPELQAVIRPEGGLLPRNVPAAQSATSFDTYEHRLLKRLLTLLQRRAQFIETLANREVVANDAFSFTAGTRLVRIRQIAEGCGAARRALRELQSLPFLAEVLPLSAFRGVTPLLQRDTNYREVYRMWQALRQTPYVAFDSPLFAIPIADLPRLYEAWCALQVVQVVLTLGGKVREQQIITIHQTGEAEELACTVDLTEQSPMLVVTRDDMTITLRYQPRYRPMTNDERRMTNDERRFPSSVLCPPSSVLRPPSGVIGSLDRHTRVPDLAIEITRPGQPSRVLVLDAKYRLDSEGRSVPQDALADAYAYLGAIGCDGERATLGALLLYPGKGAAELYASGVGAVPLLPEAADDLVEVITDFITPRRF
jgi:large subunit ribosomal protein MRP49